ncbi:MAG: cytochrome c [Paucibacter sp.]|nr:cytochrome c [Roseateles sp.]
MKFLLVPLAALAIALPAQAQFKSPEDAVKYRKSAFTLMGSHFGRLAAMAQGKVPFDAKLAAENADVLAVVVKLPYSTFGEETATVANSEAKPEVWKEMPAFKAAAEKLQGEVAKLQVAAKTGDLAQLKAAVGQTFQSCKACHDKFKEK